MKSYQSSGFEAASKTAYYKSFAKVGKRKLESRMKEIFGEHPANTVRHDSNSDSCWMEAATIGTEGLFDMPYPHVYAARHTSKDARLKSSSGGVFSALAQVIIDRDGVVYGCAFDQDLAAVHIRCETMEEVERCRGSKYSQSRMDQTIAGIKNDLKEGKTVLFTGTPCQVAAVRRCCKNMGARPSFVPSIDSPPTE